MGGIGELQNSREKRRYCGKDRIMVEKRNCGRISDETHEIVYNEYSRGHEQKGIPGTTSDGREKRNCGMTGFG